ncbi:Probable carboxylesterase 2 [Linum grandiflorum]
MADAEPSHPNQPQVATEFPGTIKINTDGTIHRLRDTDFVPPSSSSSGVSSKDVLFHPDSNLSARLHLPPSTDHRKLPLVLYFHGGGFCISSPFCSKYNRYASRIAAESQSLVVSFDYRKAPEHPIPAAYEDSNKLPLVIYYHGGGFFAASTSSKEYHTSLNRLVAESRVILVSINYRLAPENPIPTPYDDAFAALRWIFSGEAKEAEPWLKDYADFERVYLAGDSCGANMSHHFAMNKRKLELESGRTVVIRGIAMIHPYFWGKDPIGAEMKDGFRKSMVDNWWMFICRSEKGCDDPLINPFAEGSGSGQLDGLGCERVLVIVAGDDILKDRGRLYYEKLVGSGWKGTAEFVETEGKDHVFHIIEPDCVEAKGVLKRLAYFFNDQTFVVKDSATN